MKILRKKGFTLIEIIVVLIILGVLASIALPSLFMWVRKSRIAEALVTVSDIKFKIAGCIQLNPSNPNVCNSIGFGSFTSGNFTYFARVPGNPGVFRIQITSPIVGGMMTYEYDADGGVMGCSGTGDFAGLC